MRQVFPVVLLSIVASLPASFAEEATVSADIALQQLAPRDTFTILRSIAGVRGLEAVGEDGVRVSDVPERVALAKVVMEVAEAPSEVDENIPTRDLADGSVLAGVHLVHAVPREVMLAVRTEVGIARIAVDNVRPVVIVRDSPGKVEAALAVIRRLEAQ